MLFSLIRHSSHSFPDSAAAPPKKQAERIRRSALIITGEQQTASAPHKPFRGNAADRGSVCRGSGCIQPARLFIALQCGAFSGPNIRRCPMQNVCRFYIRRHRCSVSFVLHILNLTCYHISLCKLRRSSSTCYGVTFYIYVICPAKIPRC